MNKDNEYEKAWSEDDKGPAESAVEAAKKQRSEDEQAFIEAFAEGDDDDKKSKKDGKKDERDLA